MTKKIDYWAILIIFGALLVLIWALLKTIGVIHSPVWVEMIPYFGIGASIIGAAYEFGRLIKGIELTNKKVDKLLSLEMRFNKLETEHCLVMAGKLKTH